MEGFKCQLFDDHIYVDCFKCRQFDDHIYVDYFKCWQFDGDNYLDCFKCRQLVPGLSSCCLVSSGQVPVGSLPWRPDTLSSLETRYNYTLRLLKKHFDIVVILNILIKLNKYMSFLQICNSAFKRRYNVIAMNKT